MFKTYGPDVITTVTNKLTGSMDMYKIKNIEEQNMLIAEKIKCIAENIKPMDFYRYHDDNYNITNVDHKKTRFIAGRNEQKINITLCHDGTEFKTIIDGTIGTCFIATGLLINSDHITTINSMPIKKICIINGYYKIVILTMCGKIYVLDEFDSDNEYNTADKIPCDEIVDDIEYSYSIIALTKNGNVYKISNYKYKCETTLIASSMKAIKCQHYRTVCQSTDGNIYVDHLCYTEDFVKIGCLSNINIKQFECLDDHILIIDDKHNLYKIYISTDGPGFLIGIDILRYLEYYKNNKP
jgi:hypothetical protein